MTLSKTKDVVSLRASLTEDQKRVLRQRLRAPVSQGDAPTTERRDVVHTTPIDARTSSVSFEAVHDATTTASRTLPSHVELQSERENAERQDQCALRLVCGLLIELGYREGDACDACALHARLRSLPLYRKLLSKWCLELETQSILVRVGTKLTVGGGLVFAAARDVLFPEYWPRHAHEVADVLTGRRHALEILGRSGDVFETVRSFHRDTPRSRYFNRLAAAAVCASAAQIEKTRLVSILELGAGVGGTTGALLASLPRARARYDFTDLSSAFFEYAREQFAAYDGVRYRTLNMNEEFFHQGYAASSYDVVVASNAAHCAKDVPATLSRVYEVLRPGGVLVLRELTLPRCAHMIFPGLLPGFSDFEDARLTQGTPLMSADQWCRVLENAGYVHAVAFPPAEVAGALDEHVILAQRPNHGTKHAANHR